MVEAMLIWAVASFIFVKFCGYSPEGCMSAFFIMAGFGLVVSSKRGIFKAVAKGIGEAGKKLQESMKKKE